MLNGLRIGESIDRKSVEQYRSLCLLALGRAVEAESAIAAVVTADPTYRPGESESPRVRSTFTDVRKRLLPGIATARYLAAKATYDRREWAAPNSSSAPCSSLSTIPTRAAGSRDLRVLTVGFLELSASAAAPPPLRSNPAPAPAPVAARACRSAPRGSRRPDPGKIYSADDAECVPPVVDQAGHPSRAADDVATGSKPRGLMEISDRRTGPRRVDDHAACRFIPRMTCQLLAAARDWKYQPATLQRAAGEVPQADPDRGQALKVVRASRLTVQ